MDNEKPVVKLLGEDGNAYAIIGACRKAGRNAGWSNEQLEDLVAEMTSGDYNHLLITAMRHFDVE